MGSVNKVILIGNLGADPEVRQAGGKPVASLRVATSESWTDGQGQRQERTEWHSVTAWGQLAELCGQYLAKGRSVYVEGRLQSREYEKDGVKHRAWDVVASTITFLGSKPDGQQQRPQEPAQQQRGGWGQQQQQRGGWGQGRGHNDEQPPF